MKIDNRKIKYELWGGKHVTVLDDQRINLVNNHWKQVHLTYSLQVQESRMQHDEEAVKRAVNAYDDALEKYIPVLMQQAKIYWDREHYAQVEKIFRYFCLQPASSHLYFSEFYSLLP